VKYGLLLLVVGLMVISCASFKAAAAYEDEAIVAELLVNDGDWVVLTIKNNTDSQIILLADKAYYSNREDGETSRLVPLNDNMRPGAIINPIPIPSGRTVIQRFVDPAYIEYERGKLDNINNWTPSKKAIQSVIFDFEYEMEGQTRHFSFDGNQFS
jgi:hypothetical protein